MMTQKPAPTRITEDVARELAAHPDYADGGTRPTITLAPVKSMAAGFYRDILRDGRNAGTVHMGTTWQDWRNVEDGGPGPGGTPHQNITAFYSTAAHPKKVLMLPAMIPPDEVEDRVLAWAGHLEAGASTGGPVDAD